MKAFEQRGYFPQQSITALFHTHTILIVECQKDIPKSPIVNAKYK